LPISSESDIIVTRRKARELAKEVGFGLVDVTRIVTAASELARNIHSFAGEGIVQWKILNSTVKACLELVFEDNGPGIPNINQAMEVGYTTKGGLGMGLPGTKRLMDEMEIQSEVNKGTKVIIRKWLRRE
jgi:serine/threonine-protein kinase RsbT